MTSFVFIISIFHYQTDGYVKNMKKKKDTGDGIEGNWDYHPVYPVWPSAPPPTN